MNGVLSLLPAYAPGQIIAWWKRKHILWEVFLNHIQRVANALPQHCYAINLCEDRYLFSVAFAAVAARGQTNLLPPHRAAKAVQAIAESYTDSYRLTDITIQQWLMQDDDAPTAVVPAIPAEQTVAIAFTSGSTGSAQAHPKRWGDLVIGTRLAQQRFGVTAEMAIVATVPPQHMYGLETSVLLPLVAGAAVHGGRPFFPEDIRAALAEFDSPLVLISTPAHLRVCVETALVWPQLAFIVSATAPLSRTLAAKIEQTFRAPILEIYGCTEGGSLASRRTLESDFWLPYDGFTFDAVNETVSGPSLPEPVPLNDVIEVREDGRFILLGRKGDMINIAGKRASLGDLNHQLNAITGVQDGVFIALDEALGATPRLAALAVAPTLSERQILAALAECIDPAFLPRPLYKVDRLPRNDASKLPRHELLALIRDLKRS